MSKTTKEQREFVRDSYIESPESIALNLLDDLEAAEADYTAIRSRVESLENVVRELVDEGDYLVKFAQTKSGIEGWEEMRSKATALLAQSAQESESVK